MNVQLCEHCILVRPVCLCESKTQSHSSVFNPHYFILFISLLSPSSHPDESLLSINYKSSLKNPLKEQCLSLSKCEDPINKLSCSKSNIIKCTNKYEQFYGCNN